MGVKLYNTIINDVERTGRNNGAAYKLAGYLEFIGGRHVLVHIYKDAILITAKCTQEQYDKFAAVAEERYPGLCLFATRYPDEGEEVKGGVE